MTKSLNLVLTKPSGEATHLLLDLDDTPLAEAVVTALQQPGLEALQVHWSGDGFYILLGDNFTMSAMDKETGTASNFERGDVLFYKGEQGQLTLAYDDVRMSDGNDPLNCYHIGRVSESSLDDLEKVGDSIARDGVRVVTVQS